MLAVNLGLHKLQEKDSLPAPKASLPDHGCCGLAFAVRYKLAHILKAICNLLNTQLKLNIVSVTILFPGVIPFP